MRTAENAGPPQESGVGIRNSAWELCVILLSAISFAGACLMVVPWGFHIFTYLPVAFIISLLIGLTIVDIKRSIVYAVASMVLGSVIAATILLAPYSIFAASVSRVNIAGVLILSTIAKIFLLSAFVPIVGSAVGSFLGEGTLPKSESETQSQDSAG